MNSILPHNPGNWKGYTLEEIRYKRAVNLLKLEITRERIMSRKPGLGINNSFYSSLFLRVFKSLSLAEYALIFFKGVKQAEKIIRLFRR